MADLKEVYAGMETEELIRIAFVDHEDYKPEAVSVARGELEKRGISKGQEVTLAANEILQERKNAEEETETKPLPTGAKIVFLVFPLIALYYLMFTPKAWKRNKQASRYFNLGLAVWAASFLLAYISGAKTLFLVLAYIWDLVPGPNLAMF